jgi:hypothetical protein
MSQVHALLPVKCAAHSAHAFSQDSRGSNSPRAHLASPMAQIRVHQVPRSLLRQNHGISQKTQDGVGVHALTPPTGLTTLAPSTTYAGRQREGRV